MTNEIKCEVSQAIDRIAFTENIEGVQEWPHSWPKGEISYRLNNLTSDVADQWKQRRAVTVALRAWQLYIKDLKFRREYNDDVTVDFDVSFEPLEHFDGKKGVFAHAYFPGQGDISGDVHINDHWNWVTNSKQQTMSKPPLVPILIHEFGHSIGLRHDTIRRDAIMYPSFDMGKRKNQLHQWDILRAQVKYGKRRLPQWILNYFSNRRNQAWDFD